MEWLDECHVKTLEEQREKWREYSGMRRETREERIVCSTEDEARNEERKIGADNQQQERTDSPAESNTDGRLERDLLRKTPVACTLTIGQPQRR